MPNTAALFGLAAVKIYIKLNNCNTAIILGFLLNGHYIVSCSHFNSHKILNESEDSELLQEMKSESSGSVQISAQAYSFEPEYVTGTRIDKLFRALSRETNIARLSCLFIKRICRLRSHDISPP